MTPREKDKIIHLIEGKCEKIIADMVWGEPTGEGAGGIAALVDGDDVTTEQDRDDVMLGTALEGFASQVWGLSLLARAEIDSGDIVGAGTTLAKIAKLASQHAPKET